MLSTNSHEHRAALGQAPALPPGTCLPTHSRRGGGQNRPVCPWAWCSLQACHPSTTDVTAPRWPPCGLTARAYLSPVKTQTAPAGPALRPCSQSRPMRPPPGLFRVPRPQGLGPGAGGTTLTWLVEKTPELILHVGLALLQVLLLEARAWEEGDHRSGPGRLPAAVGDEGRRAASGS